MTPLEDTDPVPLVLAVLTEDEGLRAALGTGHVTGMREGPWPALVVNAGQDQPPVNGRGIVQAHVDLDLYDSPERHAGPWKMRRILMRALAVLAALPELPPRPGHPVVTNVELGTIALLEQETGQLRYSAPVTLYVVPPQG